MKQLYFTIIFLLYCTGIYYITNSQHNDHRGPYSIHNWRQADGASYARNYYQNNLPFLKPQVYTQIGKEGHTVSEFPIVYYIAGKLSGIFGFHPSILRRLHFAIFIFGCASLLWLGLLLFKHSWLALIPPILTFTSPYLYYYGLNFLPDVPALSLSFAGTFFIVSYFHDKKLWKMYVAFSLFCLACLLKISNGILFCSLMASILFSHELRTDKYFKPKHIIHFFILAFAVIAVNLWWVYFAKRFNDTYGNHINLAGIIPIWELSWKEIIAILKQFYTEWPTVILHPLNWNLFFIGIFLLATQRITIKNPLLRNITRWSFVGSIAYMILWFQAFNVHDYYLVPPFICIVIVFILLLSYADKEYERAKTLVIIGAIAIVVNSVVQVQSVISFRSKNTANGWLNESYFTIEPYLRSLGISRFDWVLSVPDPSPNVTLYYTNQPGFTNFGNWFESHCGQLKDLNVRYAIVADDRFLENQKFIASLDTLMGEYNGIKIFRVKK